MEKEVSQKITVLVLTLAFCYGAMAMVAAPLYKELKITKLKIEAEKENKKSREDFLSRIIKFGKTNEDIRQDDLEKINQLLLNKNNYEEYLSRIIYLAKINGVIASDFSVSKPAAKTKVKISEAGQLKKTPELQETTINFSAQGNFHDFMNFIKDFEKMGPLADEESLGITAMRVEVDDGTENEGEERSESGEGNKEELNLSYELNFKFYY